MATTTVKGLLKGLRYISRIFDDDKYDKGEEEMTIGFPTDVKHVAHIGWDGPTVNPPTWMNEFKKPPNPSSPVGGRRSDRTRAISAEDLTPTSGVSREKTSSRCRRATYSSSLAGECPPQRHSNNSKPMRHSRRHDYGDGAVVASPSSEEGGRRGKKQQQTAADHSSSVPKPNQSGGGQRRSKGSSGGGGGEARRSSGRRSKHSSSSDCLPDPSKADQPEHHSLPIIREQRQEPPQQKKSKDPTKLRKDPPTPSSRRGSSTPSHDFGSKPHIAKEIEGLS